MRLVASTHVPNKEFTVFLIRAIILPAYLASKFALAPSAGVSVAFPLATILTGMFLVYLITKVYLKVRK